MSDCAGAPSGGNEKESGVADGEVSADRDPDVQCGHRWGLVGDVGPELGELESVAWVAVREIVRECVRTDANGVVDVLVNVQV